MRCEVVGVDTISAYDLIAIRWGVGINSPSLERPEEAACLSQAHHAPENQRIQWGDRREQHSTTTEKLRSDKPGNASTRPCSRLHVEVISVAADQRFPLGLCLNHASALSEAPSPQRKSEVSRALWTLGALGSR